MDTNFEGLDAGSEHYKAYVGPPKKYDIVGAMQFNLLTSMGLRDYHKLLDIGCGSLRAGKLMIPYLRSGNYYGMEPNDWLIQEGIEHELGKEIIDLKSPNFSNSENFELQVFGEKFDYLIAQSIFSHASPSQIMQCLKEAKAVMNQDAIFLATFVLGKEDYEGSEWVYPGCVTFKEKTIERMISNADLVCRKLKWRHPNGQTWFAISQPTKSIDAQKEIKRLSKVDFVRYEEEIQ